MCVCVCSCGCISNQDRLVSFLRFFSTRLSGTELGWLSYSRCLARVCCIAMLAKPVDFSWRVRINFLSLHPFISTRSIRDKRDNRVYLLIRDARGACVSPEDMYHASILYRAKKYVWSVGLLARHDLDNLYNHLQQNSYFFFSKTTH